MCQMVCHLPNFLDSILHHVDESQNGLLPLILLLLVEGNQEGFLDVNPDIQKSRPQQ